MVVLAVTGVVGADLPSGHPIIEIIDANDLEIDISPGRMNEMIPADGKKITITAEYGYRQIGTGQGQSGGKRDSPAVCGVISVHIQIAGHPTGTTDAGNHHRPVNGDPGHLQPVDIGIQDHSQSAARTPDMGDPARFQILVVRMKPCCSSIRR